QFGRLLRVARDPQPSGIGEGSGLQPCTALQFYSKRKGGRPRPHPQADTARISCPAGCGGQRRADSVNPERSIHTPGSNQRLRRNHSLYSGKDVITASRLMTQDHLAVTDRQLLDGNLLGFEGRGWPHCPIDRSVSSDVDERLWPQQAHVEDQHLSTQERCKFGIHGKSVDRHGGLPVGATRYRHIGKGDGREWQEPSLGRSMHGYLAYEVGQGLLITICYVTRLIYHSI